MNSHIRPGRNPRRPSQTVEPLECRTLLAAIRVMPLGDSITEGWGDNSKVSYRFWLDKRLELAGYDVDFVGTRTGIHHGPAIYTDWDQDHQGISGALAEQVAAQVTGWANATNPQIVLLHIGTNDIAQGQSVSSTINEVGQIIDNLRLSDSQIDIFLARIIPLAGFATQINQFNMGMDTLAVMKDTTESRVIAVDHFTGFNVGADTFDGIHPVSRGERKMARKWFDALAAFLPAPPAPPPPAVTYLSDLEWVSMTNGFGPAERDQSVGPNGADDGGALWINGVTYAKGLGTHANSEIVYNLSGAYARFLSLVGIDDAASSPPASAVFEVWVDDVKVFDSGVMTGSSPAQSLDIDVAGKNSLKLIVTDSGNGADWDHGDWAMARLTTQPTVASSQFAFATAPHELEFAFRGDVSGSLGTDDLLLENLTTMQMIPSASMALDYNAATNTATFTFPGFDRGVLPDGRYRATIPAAGVTDAAGNPMPADHVLDFLFLIGDADNDGNVNLNDFDILAANFGQDERDFTQGDFDYSGNVNLDDFNLLAGRFGVSLFSADLMRFSHSSASRIIDELRL